MDVIEIPLPIMLLKQQEVEMVQDIDSQPKEKLLQRLHLHIIYLLHLNTTVLNTKKKLIGKENIQALEDLFRPKADKRL